MAQPEPTATDPFATPQDMADRSNGAIPADRPFLAEAIAAASRRIRNYCGWHIWPQLSITDLRIRAYYGYPFWLPTTQLISIDAITNAGVSVDSELVEIVDFSTDGRVDYLSWGYPSLISFTHGYADLPEDLQILALELATGELQSAGGAIREQTLASSVTWARASGRLTADDKDDLAAYKIGYQP